MSWFYLSQALHMLKISLWLSHDTGHITYCSVNYVNTISRKCFCNKSLKYIWQWFIHNKGSSHWIFSMKIEKYLNHFWRWPYGVYIDPSTMSDCKKLLVLFAYTYNPQLVGYASGLTQVLRPANETALLCNTVSHWLGRSLESALCIW